MQNPFKRKPSTRSIEDERIRLLEALVELDPSTPEYAAVLTRLDQLDEITQRSSELTKTIIPAAGAVAGVGAIYAVQQFGGMIIPKALEAIASKTPQKPNKRE
jgi:hypothetical protein